MKKITALYGSIRPAGAAQPLRSATTMSGDALVKHSAPVLHRIKLPAEKLRQASAVQGGTAASRSMHSAEATPPLTNPISQRGHYLACSDQGTRKTFPV